MSTEPQPIAPLDPEIKRAKPRVGAVAIALWNQAETRELVRELAKAQVPALLLKGPDLQQRLYGTPAAYMSGDVDILVPRTSGPRARAVLQRHGWRFERENGVLWRLSAAATFERRGFRADVHWGLHAAHLPAWSLRNLERSLWAGATRGSSGALEPDPESLLVFLAVHAAGHGFERPEWVRNVELAAAAPDLDWNNVRRIARGARVEKALLSALKRTPGGESMPLLDGFVGRTIWYGTFVARGHFIPITTRDRIREVIGMVRNGYGLRPGRGRYVGFRDLSLYVAPGVFDPQSVSAGMVDLAHELLPDLERPVIVEVGTGCGAVSILAGRSWPDARIFATDVSARAVRCARQNAKRLGVHSISFAQGSLVQPLPRAVFGRADLLFSNVPYVSPIHGKDLKDWHIPEGTIFGPDPDGLGFMRMLATASTSLLRVGGYWILQLSDDQWDYFADHLRHLGLEVLEPRVRRVGHAVIGAARVPTRARTV